MATSVTVPASGAAFGGEDPLLIRRWFGRAGWCVAIGLAMWFINHIEYPGPALHILVVMVLLAAACCAVAWFKLRSNGHANVELQNQLLDTLALKGDEKLLDVGCGAGLLSAEAAKRLKTGKVTGVDSWDPDVSTASVNAAKDHAKSAGVADRTRFEALNSLKLVYPDNQYDVVVSERYLHTLLDNIERAQVIREMLRVAKPRARVLIFDSGDTAFYAQILRESGAKDVTLSSWSFPWLVPHRSVSATK